MKKRKKWVQGSYTVEAADIMGVLLLAIGLILFLCAFVHGRACMTAVAYEQAYTERQRMPERLFGIEGVQCETDFGEKENKVIISGICTAGWNNFREDIRIEAKIEKQKPVTFIRKMQAVSQNK